MDCGANIAPVGSSGFTPLRRAASDGDEPIVKLLLEKGTEVDVVDTWFTEQTPLHLAATNEHTRVVKMLLEKGAHVYATDAKGRTPLHYVTKNAEIIKLLLNAGADINAQDKEGKTPLHLAAERGHEEIVKELMEPSA